MKQAHPQSGVDLTYIKLAGESNNRNTAMLDSTFGNAGKRTTDFGGFDAAFGLVMSSDNSFIIAGNTADSSGGSNFALARYSAAGTLDTTFGPSGSNGKVITDFGGNDSGLSLGVQSDGKLLIAGYTYTNTSARNFAVARYSPTGILDSTDGKPWLQHLRFHAC